MRKTGFLLILAIAAALLSSPAFAGTVGPNCGTCNGGIYSLTYTFAGVDSHGNNLVDVTLTIDTNHILDPAYNPDATAFAAGAPIRIDNVAVKVSSSIVGGVLTQAPGGVNDWIVFSGGINNSGCNTPKNGNGFDCADASSLNGAPVVPTSPLVWVFQLTLPQDTVVALGPDGASIKARYVDKSGNHIGSLVSTDITLTLTPPLTQVPEPGSMTLLGAGLLAVGGLLRRRGSFNTH